MSVGSSSPRIGSAWDHTRKGYIEGRVIQENETWVTVECTQPNYQADVGDVLTFRKELATETPLYPKGQDA